VVGRERHLRGADEVEVVVREPVDVRRGLAEEAGALHGARLHQGRRDHRGEAARDRLRHRHLYERELEQGTDPGEVVEPGAADLGSALDVDGAEQASELHVVARLEALGREVTWSADVLEDGVVVLPSGRSLLVGKVGQRELQLGEPLPLLLLAGLSGLDLHRQRAGLVEQRLLLRAGRGRDLLAERLLLRPETFVFGDRGPAGYVGGQQRIDEIRRLAATALGGLHALRLLPQDAKVDHPPERSEPGGLRGHGLCGTITAP
jgi:hypothetical protein